MASITIRNTMKNKNCDIIFFALRFFQTRLYYHADSLQTYVVILRTRLPRNGHSLRNRGLFEWNMTITFTSGIGMNGAATPRLALIFLPAGSTCILLVKQAPANPLSSAI